MIRRCQQLGFTIVEILVAVIITATIVSMVYGSYVAASGSAQTCTRKATALQDSHLALHQLAALIRCVYVPEDTPSHPMKNNPLSRVARDGPQVQAQPALFCGSNKSQGELLRFVTMKPLPSEGVQAQTPQTTVVTFDRESGQLILSQWSFNEITRQEPQERNRMILADAVVEMTLAYYDGSQWQSQWNSRECHGLPQAVRCDLILQDDQSKRCPSHIIAPLLCSTSIPHTTEKETSL